MTTCVLGAANTLVHCSGHTLSNLELQKLVHIAHMFCMGRNRGEPLVHGQFEAWKLQPGSPRTVSPNQVVWCWRG